MSKGVKIGCWSAFWGDSAFGAHQLVKEDLHYLVGDYLSEVTMGLLAKSKLEKLDGGAINEFATSVWQPLQSTIMKKKIKVITNAGGLNPLSLKKLVEKEAEKAGIKVKVAAIVGDDVLSITGELKPFDQEEIPKEKFLSSNAYIGAFPIAKALELGADVVITGRCVDSALVLGPLIYEYKMSPKDYDLLASGSLAGHIVECGCQCTGGNFTDWKDSFEKGWENIGYPICEFYSNGSFIITKPKGTGGIVTIGTVSEQIVYEIGDPSNYILPDVVLDFTQVKLTQKENDVVFVSGAKGYPPTTSYKVSLTWSKGFMISGSLLIGGIDALNKAKAVGSSIVNRVRKLFKMFQLPDFTDVNIEYLGAEEIYGPHSRTTRSREVLLRITVSHTVPKALGIFARELAPSATNMSPGITGSGMGRPKLSPKLYYLSALVDKKLISISIHIGESTEKFTEFLDHSKVERTISNLSSQSKINSSLTIQVPLISLCYGRSGDKGDIGNIGIIARKPEYYEFIKTHLTSQRVHEYLDYYVKGKVERYELPGIHSFNFVCTKSLGGGGLQSSRIDRQGKCLAQILLDYPVHVPIEWVQGLASKL